jgi:hypothetical protein
LDVLKQALTRLDNTLASQITPPVEVPSSTASDQAPSGFPFGEGALNETPASLGAPVASNAVDGGPTLPVDDARTGPDPRNPAVQMRDSSDPRDDGSLPIIWPGKVFPMPQSRI